MENVLLGIYCDRTGPGLLAEPLNAVTSGSFLIAAWALARRSGGLSAGLWVLLALAASVGIGSGLWHSFTGLAAYLAMRSLILSRSVTIAARGSVLSIDPGGRSERRAA